MASKTLENFIKMVEASDGDRVTKTELVKQLEAIAQPIIKAREDVLKAVAKLEKAHLSSVSKIQSDNSLSMSNIKKVAKELKDSLTNEQKSTLSTLTYKVDDKLAGVINGLDGVDGKDAEIDEDKLVKLLLSKIKLPEKGEEKLDTSSINGLDEKLDGIRNMVSRTSGSLGMRKITYTKAYDLTSQCNGTLKEFTLPNKTLSVIGIFSSQFPINFNNGVDWTFSGTTLTLTSEVDAPAKGQTLWVLIETSFFYK